MIITRARIPGRDTAVDVEIADGLVRRLVPAGSGERADERLDADGRWLHPGLWDQHVHLGLWARNRGRLDLGATSSPQEVLQQVAAALSATTDGATGDLPLIGFGFRQACWPSESAGSLVAALDAVSGEHPVALISGDAHCGWLNTAAQRRAGCRPADGIIEEGDWFEIAADLEERLGLGAVTDAELAAALDDAAARGVVGIVDFDFDGAWRTWPGRVERGLDRVRVRAACYADTLDDVTAAGHRSGDVLDTRGLVTMGPLKVISDGSLGTLTAFCRDPFPGGGHGTANVAADELTALLSTAHRHGLDGAVHAIGDAALGVALDAFEASGATGSIEHAQLATPADVARLARLGLRASVQPAHLLDDIVLIERHWAGRADDCFPLQRMRAAGVRLTFGSDAPVAPLDPWLAVSVAVTRCRPGGVPFVPAQRLDRADALAASTDARALRPGEPADLVLLEQDPLQVDAPAVALTMVAGRVTHQR